MDTGGRCCRCCWRHSGGGGVAKVGGASCYVIRMGFCLTSKMSEEDKQSSSHIAGENEMARVRKKPYVSVREGGTERERRSLPLTLSLTQCKD